MSYTVRRVPPEQFQPEETRQREIGPDGWPEHIGRPRLLAPWQASLLGKAQRLRKQLTNKALAARLGVCEHTVQKYMGEQHRLSRPKKAVQ